MDGNEAEALAREIVQREDRYRLMREALVALHAAQSGWHDRYDAAWYVAMRLAEAALGYATNPRRDS